jgi:hypothetical protein
MDLAIQAIMIIGTFSLAHERVIELLRWGIGKLPSAIASLLDEVTKGPWAFVTGTALSLITNANALDAFHVDNDHQPLFFAHYLNGLPTDFRAVVGCCIMGLAVTLGSSFWHDLAKGLIEARERLRDASVPAKQETSVAVRVAPTASGEPVLVSAKSATG